MASLGTYLRQQLAMRSSEPHWQFVHSANHGPRAARMGLVRPTRVIQETPRASIAVCHNRIRYVANRHDLLFIFRRPHTLHDDRPRSSSSLGRLFGLFRATPTSPRRRLFFSLLDSPRQFVAASIPASPTRRIDMLDYRRHDGPMHLVVFSR
jgi:hypothetical protein